MNVLQTIIIRAILAIISIFVFEYGRYRGSGTHDTSKCFHEKSNEIFALEDCPREPKKYPIDLCYASNHKSHSYIHTNDYANDLENRYGVINEVFSTLHHPDTVKADIIINESPLFKRNRPITACESVFLTRTGSKVSMSNKCQAVAKVPDGYQSYEVISHRVGTLSNLTDQYQADYMDNLAFKNENEFMPLFLKDRDDLIAAFRNKMGDIFEDGAKTVRKTVTILVANEGVLDLVLNFICSCQSAQISLQNLVVFVGQPEIMPVIENMGVLTFFSASLGEIPKSAAGFYGDDVFGVLMWLKTTSIYLASMAGYNVLFQDADLVWLKDPVPFLQSVHLDSDVVFMDDGARTARFSPAFVNSGFYFQRHTNNSLYLMERMIKSISEISVTHSHQSTLTRHITEALYLINLRIAVLPQHDFPSGYVYHHNKKYIARMVAFEALPFVFHMCWTSSREDKVVYFKDVGLWFLPSHADETADKAQACGSASSIIEFVSDNPDKSIVDRCCQRGQYWINKSNAVTTR